MSPDAACTAWSIAGARRRPGLPVARDRRRRARGWPPRARRSRGRGGSITPGREFSTNTSATPARRRTSARPVGSVERHRDAALPAAALQVRHRHPLDGRRARATVGPTERREQPALLTAGPLDRDHLRAHRREEERRQRAGDEPGDVDDAHTGQRQRRPARLGHAPVGPEGLVSSRSRCRSTNFWTLPLGVRGNSSTERTSSGHFCARGPRLRGARARRRATDRRGPRLHAHEHRGVLTEPRVGRRDDRALGDAGDPGDQLLDLLRADVLAAADDDVLLAVGDREATVLVEHADVAGRVPTVGVESLRGAAGIGVAEEAVGTAREDLARFADADIAAVVADEPHLDTRAADGRRCTRVARTDLRRSTR